MQRRPISILDELLDRARSYFPLSCAGCVLLSALTGGADELTAVRQDAKIWRSEHRIVDMHQHMDYQPKLLRRAIEVMDASGIGLGIDLTPGTVTRSPNGGPSEFERNKKIEDDLFPGRWVQYMNLDYGNWDQPDFAEQAVRQVEEGHRLGAAGFKEWKRLGLFLRDGRGDLIKVDDPKLDPMWERLGQLNMPVSIHIGDPKAFFEPYNDKNERWKELKNHRSWWFGDTNKFPSFHGLLDALNRVIARHPHTTFVCLHFGNDAEELEWVDRSLARYPNMMVDVAARIPELGRHDPEQVNRIITKYQDRILFGTDFQSLESRMILGSSGDEPPPSVSDAEVFFAKEWRWFETSDRNWEHMTPIQGDWPISSIHLPAAALRKIYFDNARKLLARSLPVLVVTARRTTRDFHPDGDLAKEVWQTVRIVRMEYLSRDGSARPDMSTSVRAVWSRDFLYLGFECPFTRLTVFEPPMQNRERFDMEKPGASLWDRDVVEAFIGNDPTSPNHYGEFELAPTNERLDVMVNLPAKDFAWNSGYESAVRINQKSKTWTAEMRIPLKSFGGSLPDAGARWRLNLFRHDHAARASVALSPTLTGTFHVPERFGVLEFVE